MARNKYGKSFQKVKDSGKAAAKAKRKAAQAKWNRARKKGGLKAYDSAAKGGGKFDMDDVRYLKKQGYKNKDIQAYARSLGAKGLSENIQLNHKAFAGGAYRGGKKVKKIEDYDAGKGFNMADVRHLKKQGFSDKQISSYANKQVKQSGKSHGNKVSKYMEKQGKLDYYHGAWNKAKAKAQAQKAKPKPKPKAPTKNNVVVDNKTPNNSQKQTGKVTMPGFPTPKKSPYVSNTQTQNVQQDNDINTTITGNNNKVTNEQDNSIRQYGGDNRSSGQGGRAIAKPFTKPVSKPVSTPVSKPAISVANKQAQDIKQDNDIATTITGDNNKVFNEQDNSIRQYGGDNRSLIINSGPNAGRNSRGNYYTDADNAITMGTLSGFYAPDNSPAAQAKFTDLNQTLNRDAQKKYSNVGITTSEKYAGFRGGDTNIMGLQKRIDQNDQYFRDLSTIQEVKTYGDRAAKRKYPTFQFGDPIEEVKSNAGDIAKGYKSSINNM